MRTRTLGKTGLHVTELCVGTSALGSSPKTYGYEVAEHRALETLRRVFQGPITFLDTSNEYGHDGSSERLIGTVLRKLGGVPEGFLVATKVDPDSTGDFSGRRVHASVRESRERLGLDHLPLVYLHDPERISFAEATAPGGPVEAMRQLQADGVIGHLGVAGGPIELLRRYVDTGVFEVVITHNRFTLLDRSAGPLLDDCAAAGVAVVNAAPFASGLLAKGPNHTDRYFYGSAPPQIVEAAKRVQAVCDRHGVPLAAAALQFSMRDPRITSTVVGITGRSGSSRPFSSPSIRFRTRCGTRSAPRPKKSGCGEREPYALSPTRRSDGESGHKPASDDRPVADRGRRHGSAVPGTCAGRRDN